ncbi:MAG: HNH endonuclease [Candidatus Dormibacteraeota bacterium]|nr:HNH endonuclease [Candidatus Dormibacteraeota bacterium]
MATQPDELGLLEAAVDRFSQQPLPEAGPALASYLERVQRANDRIALRFSEAAAAFAQTNEFDSQGSLSPLHWIRLNCHMSAGSAADRLAVGEQLERVPESHQSMVEGEIGFRHLALIARTAAAIEETGTNKPFDETPLLDKARDLSVGRFIDFCSHMRHAADPEGYAEEQARGVEARSLSLKTGEDGMLWLRGVLDPEGGAVLRTALEPLARRNGKEDDRKRDRRLADAAVELAHRSLDTGLVPQRGSQRPHLQVTASLETLLQTAGAPAADLEFSLPISAKAVERLACDCNVTRILLGSDSAVIDVGRSKRVISPAQSRALKVRDKGCRWPGCDRSATWTSGHHLVHWIRGGSTDLPNLVLLCYRHHWMVHEAKWQLVKTDDGNMLAVPPQLDLHHQLMRRPDLSRALRR